MLGGRSGDSSSGQIAVADARRQIRATGATEKIDAGTVSWMGGVREANGSARVAEDRLNGEAGRNAVAPSAANVDAAIAPGARAVSSPVAVDVPAGPAAMLVLKLAYDGKGFSGFAEQPGPRTVAGDLRRAVETFLRRPIEMTCAGRTDAGVHAIAQYVSIPIFGDELEIPRRRWLRAMDALLPEDIALVEVFHADRDFSARFDARFRTYTYRIVDGDTRPLITRNFTWWLRSSLDDEAMERAARCLVGEHDFKSFCKVASAVGKPTCRFVRAVDFKRVREMGEDHLAFTITGNAFLHSMVRTIVGSLVEVGTHRREESWLSEALAACDRTAAGPTAPAQGLCFMGVEYDPGALSLLS